MNHEREEMIVTLKSLVKAKNHTFFMGKKAAPTRAALEYIISLILGDGMTTQNGLARRYGTTPQAIRLRYKSIIKVLGWEFSIKEIKKSFYKESSQRIIVTGEQDTVLV